jgi:rRNA pseudouridine-1189 N-methylase Emg1 (Nep1/Mra1 family)
MENAENQAKWDTRHRKKAIKAHKKTQRKKLTEKQSATRTPPNNEHMVDRMGQNYVATRTPPNNEHMVDRMGQNYVATRTPPNNEHMVDRMGQNYVTTDYERPLLTKSCCTVSVTCRVCKKSLKIPKGGNQNPYMEEEQTTQ